jgi:hypothetical protein
MYSDYCEWLIKHGQEKKEIQLCIQLVRKHYLA